MRASVDSNEVEGNANSPAVNSSRPSLSSDGRYVAFDSLASNLVSNDTNGVADAFVRDGLDGNTEMVSVGAGSAPGNGVSHCPSISGDGRYVVFHSKASNLTPQDTGPGWDVFVHDRDTSSTELISAHPDGTPANDGVDLACAAISADGRYVAFRSSLPLSGEPGGRHLFMRDRVAGTTERVSVNSNGEPGTTSPLGTPAMSSDGRYVVFYADDNNLVPGDTNGDWDVILRDRVAETTERVSVAADGSQPDGTAFLPSVSNDGRFVAFRSAATNLVVDDDNDIEDAFVRDRVSGATELVSVASDGTQANNLSGNPWISGDGKYVVFSSSASNLVAGIGTWNHTYVRDRERRETWVASPSATGRSANGSSFWPSISADGRFVAFWSLASDIVGDDTNGVWDVFVRSRGPTFTLSPRSQRAVAGQWVTVHANTGFPGDEIVIQVVSGPNQGVAFRCFNAVGVDPDPCVTGPDHEVTWSYRSSAEAGNHEVDEVVAAVDMDGDGQIDPGEPRAHASVQYHSEPIDYVALGDSFSAGEGLGHYVGDTDNSINQCHRSERAYPPLLEVPYAHETLPPTDWRIPVQDNTRFTFGACSGATIFNVVDASRTQYDEPRQLEYLLLDANFLTIGISGNDAAFGDILTSCYLHACLGTFDFRDGLNVENWYHQVARLTIEDQLEAALTEARSLLGRELGGVDIPSSMVVVGYPFLLPEDEDEQNCAKLVGLRGEMDTLREMNHDLNELIRDVAARVGVHHVSLEEVYAGHEVCTNDEWINGPVFDWRRARSGFVGLASFHPKREGHVQTAIAINDFIQDWIADGKPLTDALLPVNPEPQGAPEGNTAESSDDPTAAVADPAPAMALARAGSACVAGRDSLDPGETVTVTGTNWQPSGSVHVSYTSPMTGELAGVDVIADSAGAFSATLTMPSITTPVLGGFDARGVDTTGATFRTGQFSQLAQPGPCAADDLVPTSVTTSVVIPVLANDSAGPAPGTVEVIDPADGTTEVDATTGAITYTPRGDFTGIDIFAYQVCDTAGRCDTADVGIGVSAGCTTTGTDGDDTLVGTSGRDVICALAGNDTVEGLGGDDVILGGPGIDQLFGGEGNDTILGGRGDDVLNGGPGTDQLDGGSGVNQLLETTDEQPPIITITAPADGAQYLTGSTVTADYTCIDNEGGIGVARCDGPVPSGENLDTSTPGAYRFEVNTTDWAGNATNRRVTYDVVPP